MIDEPALHEAISECQGVRNPSANTCLKLASYYTILDHIQKEEPVRYSYASNPDVVDLSFSDSEFANMASGKPAEDMWRLMVELMETIRVINPRLYDGVMRKVVEL